jgi:hypothetical protein
MLKSPIRLATKSAGERVTRIGSPSQAPDRFWIMMIIAATILLLAGCATQEPTPAPPPSSFDRAWNAALGAAQDEGVQITSADRVTGMITGVRGQQEIRMNLQTQADGNVRVEMSARGPKGSDPGLAGRISRAYDRRMGR